MRSIKHSKSLVPVKTQLVIEKAQENIDWVLNKRKELKEQEYNDHLKFFRNYRTGFLWWKKPLSEEEAVRYANIAMDKDWVRSWEIYADNWLVRCKALLTAAKISTEDVIYISLEEMEIFED